MGQKVHPHGMRVGVIKDWDSRWYARPDKVGDLIVEDHKIRTYLKKTLYSAGVPTIEIERDSAVQRGRSHHRDRTRQRQGPHLYPLLPPRRRHRQGRR